MAPVEPLPISAVVLAGGLSRRLGGEDKGLIELEGLPLAAWVAERLRARVGEVLLNANRSLDRYAGIGYTVVPDTLSDHPGPLAGVIAAALTARQPWLLSAPCDAPFLPLDLAERLHRHALASDAPLARAADETGTHYAVMLVHRELIPDLRAFVAAGGRQVQTWQARHACATVMFDDDPYAFLNVNTPEDLRLARRLAPRYRP